MSSVKIHKFPRKMEELLDRKGKDEFIDFLNDSFAHQEESVLKLVSDSFDRRVAEESAKTRQEIYKLDNRLTEESADLRTSIAHLDNRITDEISGVKVSIAELRAEIKSDISHLHAAITLQTRWMVAFRLKKQIYST